MHIASLNIAHFREPSFCRRKIHTTGLHVLKMRRRSAENTLSMCRFCIDGRSDHLIGSKGCVQSPSHSSPPLRFAVLTQKKKETAMKLATILLASAFALSGTFAFAQSG